MKAANLYESPDLRAVTGPTLRPGGLALTTKALSICSFPIAAPVLDVGCGEGATVAFLVHNRGLQAVGLDFSALMLQAARQQDQTLNLIRGKAEFLPIAEATIMGVFCECVLSLLSDPLVALQEFHRLLLPGGFLILTDIYSRANRVDPLLNRLPLNCCLKGTVGRGQIEDRVREVGFNILLWEDHSELLKQWAARMVFAFGSMETFWKTFIHPFDPQDVECSLQSTRPGYYLLIAQKEA
jgi:arsenite methyltransferase